MKKLLAGVVLATALGILTGCSAQVPVIFPVTQAPIDRLDPALFRAASRLYTVSVAEQGGKIQYVAKPTVRLIDETNKKKWAYFALGIFRASSSSPFLFSIIGFSSPYKGHLQDRLTLSSKSGVFTATQGNINKSASGGNVSVTSVTNLNHAQIANFCRVVRSPVRITLGDSAKKIEQFTAELGPKSQNSFAAGCTIWQGLHQGYSPN